MTSDIPMASVTCPLDLHMVDLESPPASDLPDLDLLALKCPSQTTVTEFPDSPSLSRSPSVTSFDSQLTEKCISPTGSALSSEPSSPTMEIPKRKRKPPQTGTSSIPAATVYPFDQRPRTTLSRPSSASPWFATLDPTGCQREYRDRLFNADGSTRQAAISLGTASRIMPPFQEQDSMKQPATFSIDERRPSLFSAPSITFDHRRETRISSDNDFSAPSSPISPSPSAPPFDFEHRGSVSSTTPPHFLSYRDRSSTLPSNDSPAMLPTHTHSFSTSSVHVPATVIEWTSPATRRAEYEKIDRASRGVRGFWRRVAPRWCQSRVSRTPFFEEGKTKAEREGSVRRFRMDLPEEEESPRRSKPLTLKSLGLSGGN
ncbi:hypothetical protein POX_f08260 [Penicillium oxalicum]|uniref:hypothetical protein n=1 Tax=Penicillium oxalicum TaxID=69781 RepID=UPI0020B75606|nr:hypothetical protein POX_f08260 [Penicillium oxalicum]KAI2787879.1 hypothetical protein POX_f08260 [Penicillium oxalicum]